MSGRPWTEADRDVLRARYPTDTAADIARDLGRGLAAVYQQAQSLGLRKSREIIAKIARDRSREPGHGGKKTCFCKGHQTWNKGVNYNPGGRSAETRFKAVRPPWQSHNYQPIGSVRVTKDGVVERKVSDDQSLPPARRWVAEARLVWEAVHGPVPRGHAVVFKPGRSTTDIAGITIDAIELVTRADLMARNTRHRLPKAINDAIVLKGALTRRINKLTRSTET